MKKLTNLLIVASLALAGAVMAQQPTPDESQAPGKKPEKKPPTEVKPAPHAPKAEAPHVKEPAAKEPAAKEPAAKEPAAKELPATKPDRKGPKSAATVAPESKAEQPATNMTPAAKKEQPTSRNKDMKAPGANASATPATAKTTPAAPATTPATAASVTPAVAAATATPAAAATASAAPSVAAQTTGATAPNPAAAKKPEPQKIQQIQQQHASFHAQPRPDRVPAVTFTANYRVQGSDRWQGPQYEVFRSYHPEWHDQGWYRSHYNRVELIGGGYYYFNSGYWYPAWGYNSSNEYYAYDAPIYAGKRGEPADKVIADVQAALQDMGYYKGEVDGLLGPLTREALTSYQSEQGMVATAVIDEPTLDALGMG